MLIIKAFVNSRQIDEVHIHNVKDLGKGFCEYAVEKPQGLVPNIRHRRSLPWYYLGAKALGGMVEAHMEGCL